MVGLRRPGGVFCVGGGRRLARRVPNEFGLWRPSADGRPAPTGRGSFASAEADAWRGGCRMNSVWEGLRPVVGLRRPKGWSLRRRRPTPGAERLRRPISIGVEAFGHVCRMNSACGGLRPMVGLRRPGGVFCVGGGRRLACSASEGRFQSAWRPSAGGRPAPTGRVSFALAEADAWRAAPLKADFNRRGGLRPAVGLRRPGGCLLRWRRPTPGAQAPWKADFNRRGGLRPTVGLRRPKGQLLRRRRPTPGAER